VQRAARRARPARSITTSTTFTTITTTRRTTMIGYITLGTNNLGAARAFYDALLGEIGAGQVMANDRMIIWGTGPTAPMLGLCTPYDGQPATAGNGTMIALNVGARENVDKLHARALALGGRDEGAPGPRGGAGYFGYFRDLDGNKIAAYTMG
jgi:catechol 2,3-dioxygenase-like lactoylglutathione lyase family enzyme